MRFTRRLAAPAAVIVLLSCSFTPARAATRSKQPTGTLAGKVLWNNAAVPEATVHLWHDGKEAATVHVGQNGEFQLPLRDGTYEVQAAAPNFRPAVATRITVVVHADHETWVNLDLLR